MQWDECGDEDYGIIYAWSRYRLKRTRFFLRPDILFLVTVSLTGLFFASSPDRLLFSIPVVFLLSALFLIYIAITETSRMTKKGLILHLESTLIPREKSLEDLLHYFARLSWPALLGYVIFALAVFQYHAHKQIDAPFFVNILHATTLALGFGAAIAPGWIIQSYVLPGVCIHFGSGNRYSPLGVLLILAICFMFILFGTWCFMAYTFLFVEMIWPTPLIDFD